MNLSIITRLDIIRRLDVPPPLARLTLHTTEITGTPDTSAQARAAFGRTHAVLFPGLLAPDLLSYVRREIERDGFFMRVHDALPSRPTDLQLNASLALLAALLIAAFAAPIMAIYGSSFRGERLVLIALAFSALPEALNAILGQPLIAAHLMWWRFAFDLLLVAVLMTLAWVLIPKWGALGLAVSYGLAYTVTSLGLVIFARQRVLA